MSDNSNLKMASNASRPKKRFVGRKTATPSKAGSSSVIASQIPASVLEDVELNAAIEQLPSNYSFEIHKTIHNVRRNNATMVALQMPEGLQMFACTIADIIEQFTPALTVIMGDVTYGACCVDDYTAIALGCDMLIHYGHSCLVPIDTTTIKTLYIFVEISIDSYHLIQTVRHNFPNDRKSFQTQLLSREEDRRKLASGSQIGVNRHLLIESQSDSAAQSEVETCLELTTSTAESTEPTRLALVSTIQFVAALQRLKDDLVVDHDAADCASAESSNSSPKLWTGKYEATIPRSKPLSPGEILGCTAPRLQDVDALIYLGDGRFHLESIMIANPTVPAFRYDPYSKKLTREWYEHYEMRQLRHQAVQQARLSIEPSHSHIKSELGSSALSAPEPPVWGVILGTLGRQGSFKQLQAITNQLQRAKSPISHVNILLSEVSPAKLALFSPHIATFVQTSCPRLSIDWGYAFDKPLLSPYETAVALQENKGWLNEDKSNNDQAYEMNFYEAGTPWAVSRLKGVFD